METFKKEDINTLCIPRVFSNIDEPTIRRIFEELQMGIIGRIDVIKPHTQKDQNHNRVFIHYKKWFDQGNAVIARERLLNGKDIKVIYDEPWFWKVSNYRESKIKTNNKVIQNNSKENKQNKEYKKDEEN